MALTSANEPTTQGLAGSGGIPSAGNLIVTFPMAASASVSVGDWIKLSSTTAGTIAKCTSTADSPIGIANTTRDNSSGAAGDVYCPVVVRGVVYQDVAVAASGNSGPAVNFWDFLYLSGTASGGTEGQSLTSTSTANGNVIVARSLDRVAGTPTSSTLYKIRVYLDMLSRGLTL